MFYFQNAILIFCNSPAKIHASTAQSSKKIKQNFILLENVSFQFYTKINVLNREKIYSGLLFFVALAL